MSDWHRRSRVEACLLNPAVVGLAMTFAADGYAAERDDMPWPLAFLVPPLVLHRPTRDALPRDTRTHFATWVARNPLLIAGYPRRARSMPEPSREGLRFVIRTGVAEVARGALRPIDLHEPSPGELRQLMRAASLIGRWLARLDQPSTPFALLGVAP